MNKKFIFLSKNGKVEGPLSPGEIELLRQTGELYTYEMIWLNSIVGWTPIEEELNPFHRYPSLLHLCVTKTPPHFSGLNADGLSSKIAVNLFELKSLGIGQVNRSPKTGCTFESEQSSRDLTFFGTGHAMSSSNL
jgi:hypothetical protein